MFKYNNRNTRTRCLYKTKTSECQWLIFLILFYFFCVSNFLAPIILHPETVKLNVKKSYSLVDLMEGVGVLAFLCGEVVNLILWTFYIAMSCNNKNYYIAVSSLK